MVFLICIKSAALTDIHNFNLTKAILYTYVPRILTSYLHSCQ